MSLKNILKILEVGIEDTVRWNWWFRSGTWQDQDGTGVPSWSCSKAVYKPTTHTTAECTV